MEANIEEIRGAVSDVFSNFYNQVIKKRFDGIDHEITDLRLTNEALVKIVDYTRLEARVLELEDRINKLETK